MAIDKLLWVSGFPAHYFRNLHKKLDEDPACNVRYIFVPYAGHYTKERDYERGYVSPRALVFAKETRRECGRLVDDYSRSEKSGILFSGFYPRVLFLWFMRVRNRPCKKLIFMDENIFNVTNRNFLRNRLYSWVISQFDTMMMIGSNNCLTYRYLLSVKEYDKKEKKHFPLPHVSSDFCISNRKPLEADAVLRFLYLGRVAPEKNLIAFLKACRILLDDGINRFRVTIVGEGVEKQALTNYVAGNALQENVSIRDAVATDLVKSVYEKNDIFVLPSNSDQWGLVVNEALSAGLPVITPAWVGAAADLIIDGHNGKILFNNDALSIAAEMRQYIEDPLRVNVQSKNAAQSVLLAKKTINESFNSLRSLFGAS